MRSCIIPALLLTKWPSIVDAALLNPVQYLEPREKHETRQEFDQTTEIFKQQGLCRFYPSQNGGRTGLEICEPKCGDLVKKAQKAGEMTSVSCVTGGTNIPKNTDPNGNQYSPGKCVCDIPILEELVNDVLMALPAVAEIGCSILFNAFEKVLEIGAMAIPGVGAEMTAGMKAAVQAAKTVTENGQTASSFVSWFAKPCGAGKYAAMIDKIFDPMSNVPDSVVPGLGCKSKKCPGGKKDPDKDKGDHAPSTKDNDKRPSTNPASSKAQPTAPNTQRPSTTKPSTTACSTKTAPSCIRECTLVAKSGGGTTTTCATPSCATVTQCSATATTTTKFTSATATLVCAASCSKCKSKRQGSTSPSGLSQLAGRTLPGLEHYFDRDEFVAGEIRAGGDKVLQDSTRMEGGERVGTSSAKFLPFEKIAFNTAIQGLWGCTGVLVMSDRGIWLGHFWQRPSFESPERFNVDVLWALEHGDGSNNLPGLRQYAVKGGPFGPDAKWRQMIIFSSRNRQNPQPEVYQYAKEIKALEATLHRIVPETKIGPLYYTPPLYEYQLVHAKPRDGTLLVQYDPRQPTEAEYGQGQVCTVNVPTIRVYAEGNLAYTMAWPSNPNQYRKRESKCNPNDKGLKLLPPKGDGAPKSPRSNIGHKVIAHN